MLPTSTFCLLVFFHHSLDLNLEKHGKKQHVFDYERLSKPKKYKELCVRETRWTMDNLFKLHRDLKSEFFKLIYLLLKWLYTSGLHA